MEGSGGRQRESKKGLINWIRRLACARDGAHERARESERGRVTKECNDHVARRNAKGVALFLGLGVILCWRLGTLKASPIQRGGGWFARGLFRRGRFLKEENFFAASRNPEACCYFLVGSGWLLIFPGRLWMETNTSLSILSVWYTAAHVWIHSTPQHLNSQ